MSAPRLPDERAAAVAVVLAGALAWFAVMVADLAVIILQREDAHHVER